MSLQTYTETKGAEENRVFDSLAFHADTAERVCQRIEEFIDRCRGREAQNVKNGVTEVCTGHFAQLERLNKALSRAEDLARELASIG